MGVCCIFSYFDIGIRRPTGLLVSCAQHGHGVQGGRGGDGGGLQLGRVQRPLQEQVRHTAHPAMQIKLELQTIIDHHGDTD